MSCFTIRPCGPVPRMCARSILASAASRRASGEAKMRPLPFALHRANRRSPVPLRLGEGDAGRGIPLADADGSCSGKLARASSLERAGVEGCALPKAAEASSPSVKKHRNRRVHRHALRPFGDHDLADHALVHRLDLHGRLVGLDLGDGVAGGDLIALLLQPFRKLALLHGGRQRGHEDGSRHGVILGARRRRYAGSVACVERDFGEAVYRATERPRRASASPRRG